MACVPAYLQVPFRLSRNMRTLLQSQLDRTITFTATLCMTLYADSYVLSNKIINFFPYAIRCNAMNAKVRHFIYTHVLLKDF